MRRLLALSAVVAACATPAVARATPNFPGAIQSHLGGSAPPACRVCHVDGITGLGTVNTPFGKNMRARGLVAEDEASLVAALDAMAKEGVDSSGGRGTPDVEILREGLDPNRANPYDAPAPPTYGCGAQVARGHAGAGLSGLFGLGLSVTALAAARAARGSARRRR
jgi:hypothetical protein